MMILSFPTLPATCPSLSLSFFVCFARSLIRPTITSHNLPFAYRGTPIRQLARKNHMASAPQHMAPNIAAASSYSISMSIFNFLIFSFSLLVSALNGNRNGQIRLRQLMGRVSAAMSAIFSCLHPFPVHPTYPPCSLSLLLPFPHFHIKCGVGY